jgi:predicted MFS family arabinose efflux permease
LALQKALVLFMKQPILGLLPKNQVVVVFLSFALAYFLSTLVRAITATLSPTLSEEFNLSAQDLGLLAGAYFLGFALTQLPLGQWLDRFGPRRVILSFLSIAVLGSLAFSASDSFWALLASRFFMGMGVSACLMAPLTAYRKWFDRDTQLRANAWMLMTGSMGMLAATLPVQWLLPIWGWRGLFVALALLLLIAMALIFWLVPACAPPTSVPRTSDQISHDDYQAVWRSRSFWRMVPIGFFCHGSMVAMLTLWAAQWLTQVANYSAAAAAYGLFVIHLGVLISFWLWGLVTPTLAKRGLRVETLVAWSVPIAILALFALAWNPAQLPQLALPGLLLFCVVSSVVTLIQPALGLQFPASQAGRALSAYNLVVLLGIFCVQWGVGLVVDAGQTHGLTQMVAYQIAWICLALCCLMAWLFFVFSMPGPLSNTHSASDKSPKTPAG